MTETTTAPAFAPPSPNGTNPNGPKDFSRPRKRIFFTIDGEEFDSAVGLAAEVFVEFTVRFKQFNESDTWADNYAALRAALELVMLPESFERLAARLKDKSNPVDMEQMADIVIWLLEAYGLRPTRQSSDSSDGQPSPEPGTSSTENSPVEVSISELSLPNDS